ncbi:MAG: hypothetical protein COV66_13800 [Nitrospinae bacterium CG11_big_fil_rev_8_21_14_0_20_45_15]|nr:MAG: hypothetical protein COV66_13800 [Nitrospinae bacterium CG11_big_fil_rev_8_21_14_0_20_45_15]
MRKMSFLLVFVFTILFPLSAMANESPMHLPEGSNESANMHNEAGIKHWGMGHADEALKHFKEAAAADSSIAEIHFNEALALDKLGQHGEATKHFQKAKDNAHGNDKILHSDILNGHLSH